MQFNEIISEDFAPSKTFLIGEYSVLNQGSAILLSTTKLFQLTIYNCENLLVDFAIDENDPSYKFTVNHPNIFAKKKIVFTDPYDGKGGFGSSSAMFLMLYKFYIQNIGVPFDYQNFLQEYWKYSSKKGTRPSGADCVAQNNMGITFFDPKNFNVETLHWKFKTLDFAIFKTKTKIKTHLHLEEIENINIDLESEVLSAKESLLNGDSEKLARSINDSHKILLSNNLVFEKTTYYINILLQNDEVLAAKGCGSLGADALIVLTRKKSLENVKKLAEQLELDYIGNSDKLFYK